MKNRKMLYFTVILFASLFALWGCPKKAEVTSVPEAQQPAAVKAEAEPKAKEDQRSVQQPQARVCSPSILISISHSSAMAPRP